MVIAASALAVSVCLAGSGTLREFVLWLIPTEQIVTRSHFETDIVTRTVQELWYCGSDEQYDHFIVFGKRYAVLRSEQIPVEHIRFPFEKDGRTIPLSPEQLVTPSPIAAPNNAELADKVRKFVP